MAIPSSTGSPTGVGQSPHTFPSSSQELKNYTKKVKRLQNHKLLPKAIAKKDINITSYIFSNIKVPLKGEVAHKVPIR